MNDNEKAVEEMANIIGDAMSVSSHYGELGLLIEAKYDLGKDIAKLLYRIGYRPASEVRAEAVKEFADRIKRYARDGLWGDDDYFEIRYDLFAEEIDKIAASFGAEVTE